MATSLDNVLNLVSVEHEHMEALNATFVYLAALAETKRRGHSTLWECLDHWGCLAPDLPQSCDDELARQLHVAITSFIEKCPGHPNVGSAFRIVRDLSPGPDSKAYFLAKLKYYYAQGDAQNVFQLCCVLTDLGMHIFRDEKGIFMMSRSSCEAETNMGVARRFLERLSVEPDAAPNGGPATELGKSEVSEGPPSVS
jgi:hypothetical protein